MLAHAGPRPGKTAPRLIVDLLTYDPRYEERAGRNLLTTAPPHYDPSAAPVPAVPSRNCRHNFMVKHEQSKVPGVEAPSCGDRYKVATYCQICRWHMDLCLDLRASGPTSMLCHRSDDQYVLHHFQCVEDDTDQEQSWANPIAPRRFRFQCSAPKCPADLTIHMRPPRFSDHHIRLLTDQAELRRRWQAAKALDTDRADHQMARPIDGLNFLNTYLADSLNPQRGKSRIPVLNRKFVTTFGKDCDQILRQLGFTYAIESQEDGPDLEVWYLPSPRPSGDPLDPDLDRTIIEDSQHELAVLILSRPEAERTNIRHVVTHPQPAIKILERTLDCQEYPKKPLLGTRSASHEEDHPYYAGLGAVGDFSDALLLFAFASQMSADPPNTPYYFECLQDLAIGRKSDFLETNVQVLASQGQSNRNEVAKAYKTIGMDPAHAHILTDDHIIGHFKARLQDIGPSAVEEARNALRIIAYARHSEPLMLIASNAIETYSQALSWLGLDEGQPDDFIVTMYTLKVGENATDEAIARRAVEIIAQYRKSQKLQEWLVSGHLAGTAEMDVGEAYALLDIQNRTEALDLETLREAVNFACLDNPDNKDKYEKAYLLICKDQQTNHKSSETELNLARKKYPLDSWPVGCKNNGNTCYLNSVLQFLFTIKPVRDMVLDCDANFQDISPEALKTKRVGRSEVTVAKVETAQQFVHELRDLFQHMISANTDCIRPKMRLAALALAKTTSTLSQLDVPEPVQDGSSELTLGHIGGLPVAGPAPNPDGLNQANNPDTAPITDAIMGDDDAHVNGLPPITVEADVDGGHPMELVEPLSEGESRADSKPQPPSRPPPIPPRPLNLKEIEGLAQQQDASEILNNVFDLLSCAFRGDGTIRDGEQNDLIKKLFFSDVTTVLNLSSGTITRSAIKDHHLISPGRRDRPLYAALDDEFSLQELEDLEQNQTTTATKFDYIATASPIQIINVRRLLYEGGKATKDESHLGLDEVLYLDRYLSKTKSLSQTALQDLREKQWQLQRKLNSLEGRKKVLHETELKVSLPDAVDEAAILIEDINKVDNETLIQLEPNPIPTYTELPGQLRDRARELHKEVTILEAKMKELDEQINSIFWNCKDHPYRLHAVFMHRGSAKAGHYWIYIYDSQNKLWRNYNDEYVDEVEIKKVLEQEGTATSTGVVYVQDDLIDTLTQAVHRKLDSVPEDVDNTTEMNGTQSGKFDDVQYIDGIEMD